MHWFVYILRCSDNSLYTGITTDVERRIKEHNATKSITRYTRARQPVELVYQEKVGSRSSAGKREIHIKKLKRTEKEALIEKKSINSFRSKYRKNAKKGGDGKRLRKYS